MWGTPAYFTENLGWKRQTSGELISTRNHSQLSELHWKLELERASSFIMRKSKVAVSSCCSASNIWLIAFNQLKQSLWQLWHLKIDREAFTGIDMSMRKEIKLWATIRHTLGNFIQNVIATRSADDHELPEFLSCGIRPWGTFTWQITWEVFYMIWLFAVIFFSCFPWRPE